jgi:hypothetical protein
LAGAQALLAAIAQRHEAGDERLTSSQSAVAIEVAIAKAELAADVNSAQASSEPLMRLRTQQWMLEDNEIARLLAVIDPAVQVIEFEHDISQFLTAQTVADFPSCPVPEPCFVVVFGCGSGERRPPILIDRITAQILTLSDGTRTLTDIARLASVHSGSPSPEALVDWIAQLFLSGLILLREQHLPPRGELPLPAQRVAA